jgi:hypothetical protein
MSIEKNLQSVFNDCLNHIDKVVRPYVKNYQPVVSKHEEREGYLISIMANCTNPFCKHRVMASISTTEERWSKQLVDHFIRRAEFHAKSQHNAKGPFLMIPNTLIRPSRGGFRGNG